MTNERERIEKELILCDFCPETDYVIDFVLTERKAAYEQGQKDLLKKHDTNEIKEIDMANGEQEIKRQAQIEVLEEIKFCEKKPGTTSDCEECPNESPLEYEICEKLQELKSEGK